MKYALLPLEILKLILFYYDSIQFHKKHKKIIQAIKNIKIYVIFESPLTLSPDTRKFHSYPDIDKPTYTRHVVHELPKNFSKTCTRWVNSVCGCCKSDNLSNNANIAWYCPTCFAAFFSSEPKNAKKQYYKYNGCYFAK